MLLFITLSTAIHEENTRNSILTGFTIKLIYNNILTTYYICNSMHNLHMFRRRYAQSA